VLYPHAIGPWQPASAHGELLFSFKGDQCVDDISVIHTSPIYCAAAAKTDGGVAAWWDADKTSQYSLYWRYKADCYWIVPFTFETCSRLGRPFMDLLTDVLSRSSQHSNGTFTSDRFVSDVLANGPFA
jgi:hypothetical protein